MSSSFVGKWIQFGLVGGAALVLTGCPEDAADITEQASEPAFNFPISSAFVEPAGEFSIDNIVLAAFDTSVTDAFGKSDDGPGSYFDQDCLAAAGGGFNCWDFSDLGRNSSTDPRLPALADADANVVPDDPDGLVVIDPSGLCTGPCPFHNIFNFAAPFANLDPSTTYIAALFRYAVQPNGELDANLIANGEPLDAPDELIPLGGMPIGDPTTVMAFPSFTVPMDANANPFILGNFTTDGTGVGAMDIILDGSPGFLYNDDSGDPSETALEDSVFIARDDDTFTSLPKYNYLVIMEAQGATTAADAADNPQVMRFQIGQDFNVGGTDLVNNAYSPFPDGALTDAEKVLLPGGAGRPDSLTVTFNNLEALSGSARYEAWLVNPLTGSMVPAVGDYQKRQIEIELDPVTGEVVSIEDTLVVETVTGTASFAGDASGQGFRHDLIISDNSLGQDTLGVHSYLTLTTTSSPGGSTIPDSRPIWFQFTDQNGTADNFFDDISNPDNGQTSFGNFEPMDPSSSRPYIGVGQGTGGVRALDRDAETGLVTSGILSADLQALSRPPRGYVLQGWVVSEDGSQAFQTQPITGPPPEFVDITSADGETVQGIVTENGILRANFRLNSSEAGIDFTNFFNFMVTLEPKLGISGMGPIPVQSGVLPGEVTTPVPQE